MARRNDLSAQRRYLKIKHWDRIQNPKRTDKMPWTRLHRDWLENYDFTQLSMTARGTLLCLHMLAARSANRIPLDYRWIANKVVARPQDVGKAVATLKRAGFVEEFAEDLETRKNRDLQQILGTELVSKEGEKEKDKEQGSPQEAEVSKLKPLRRKQPSFEVMTRTCMKAGLRGSDYMQIGKLIEKEFGFLLSERQLAALERQIIDRRAE